MFSSSILTGATSTVLATIPPWPNAKPSNTLDVIVFTLTTVPFVPFEASVMRNVATYGRTLLPKRLLVFTVPSTLVVGTSKNTFVSCRFEDLQFPPAGSVSIISWYLKKLNALLTADTTSAGSAANVHEVPFGLARGSTGVPPNRPPTHATPTLTPAMRQRPRA